LDVYEVFEYFDMLWMGAYGPIILIRWSGGEDSIR
jgi:hypothetical protein